MQLPNDNAINALRYLICRIKRLGRKTGLRYKQLYADVKKLQPQKILEIGVYTGDNAVLLLKQIDPDISVEYYGFDLFEDLDAEMFQKETAIQPLSKDIIRNKIEKSGQATVHLHKGDTTKISDEFINTLPKMDLIFIDGGHSIETQWNDWLIAEKLMHDNTVVYVDDCWNLPNSGSRFMLDRLKDSQYEVEILPTKDFFKKQKGYLITQFLKITNKAK